MKIKPFVKPVALGATLIAATNFVSPKYIEIAAVGAGLYILYSIVTYKEDAPSAINVRYDKQSNKVIADIKNPSDNTFAFLSQIRLINAMKPVAEGMEPAMAMTERSTLIGETDLPIVIGPKETISIECPLLIPQEMYETTDGTLNIKLSFHDVQEAIEIITKKKTEQKITQIEQKIEPIIEPSTVETIENPPTSGIISPMPATDADLQRYLNEPETIITYIPQSEEKIKEVIENFVEEFPLVNSLSLASVPIGDKHSGRGIGCSQTMLQIIASLDRLKSINLGNDAI